MNEWIKAEDKLPPEGELVLCWYEYFRFGVTTECFKHSVLDAITLETDAVKLQTESERV